MATEVTICNRALQKLGAKRIMSLDEDSPNARACKNAYPTLRDAELRAYRWNFAKKRTVLAQTADELPYGGFNLYTLPADFLGMREDEYTYLAQKRQVEGKYLLSLESGSLLFPYTARITDVNQMDVLFQELLSTKIAFELCEEITQSNAKKEGLRADYRDIIKEARRVNAIETMVIDPPEDDWITGRR